MSVPIPILYEESHFLIVDKPAGIFSQAPPGIESVQERLIEQLKQRDEHHGKPFVGLPHRLDRGTSGVLLIARNQRALARFGQQFQSRKVGKYYLAVVAGDASSVDNDWQDYLRKIPDHPLSEIVPSHASDGKLAKLSVRILASSRAKSLLAVRLHTGRMHQIRVQSASRGLPILGDKVYGAAAITEPGVRKRHFDSETPIALHALRLEFRHPQNAKLMSCTAPPPDTFREFASGCWTELDAIVKQSMHDQHVAW
ncbi:MAG: RluA family pseudouridine synthase [Planctomycetales bacterium]|nr:RluA family pseudouridine synthase [Planctomycetales bacterium]